MIELQINGHIIGKKNRLVFNRKLNRPVYSTEVRDCLDSIREQLERQWVEETQLNGRVITTQRIPLDDPAIAFVFYVTVRGARADRDGLLTTVLDEMVKVGILKDDCISSWNGPCLITSAVTTDFSGVRIFIEPHGDLERLHRHLRKADLAGFRLKKPVDGGFRLARV